MEMILRTLKIDKSSVELRYLFKSLKIVEMNNGKIDRFNFIIHMETYMKNIYSNITGKDLLNWGYSCVYYLLKSPSVLNAGEYKRTAYNKTKLARYYGLLRIAKDKNTTFIFLTKRGKEICDIIEELHNKNFNIKDYNKLKKNILSSVLFDSFGKNNDGMEQSKSDVEPPKILLKAILDLNYITSEEYIFLIFALDNKDYNNLGDALEEIKKSRRESNDFISTRINELSELYRKNLQNFINDNKMISFFEQIKIIDKYEEKFYLNDEIKREYTGLIKKLNPFYKNLQLLLIGNPGSGKSYYINNIILGNIVETKQVVRTIIYPDYDYSDFIGFIKPTTINKKINYSFEPGPFTLALEKCFKNPKKNIYLVIEDINRGNISAIFGDIFQLLDRFDNFNSSKHCMSKYYIKNDYVYNYLFKKLNSTQRRKLKKNRIFLPSNLHLIMSLNNSEENNYFLDTAFKRRFNYTFLHESDPILNTDYILQLDNISKKKIFNEKYSWSTFVSKVNIEIDKANKDFNTIPESKKLSPYFVNLDDVNDKEQFCDKVIYYLKNDVFKYNENILNKNYDTLRNLFINGKDFFEIMGDD